MPRNTSATTKSLLVLDFDKTIIYPHTFQHLCNLDDEQAYQTVCNGLKTGVFNIINKKKLVALIRKTLDTNDFVAVASFTNKPIAIRAALEFMGFDNVDINKILIEAWLPEEQDQDIFGKNKHLLNLIKECKDDVNNVVLVDDDQNNINLLKKISTHSDVDSVSNINFCGINVPKFNKIDIINDKCESKYLEKASTELFKNSPGILATVVAWAMAIIKAANNAWSNLLNLIGWRNASELKPGVNDKEQQNPPQEPTRLTSVPSIGTPNTFYQEPRQQTLLHTQRAASALQANGDQSNDNGARRNKSCTIS